MYPLSLVPSIIPAKRFHCAGKVRFLAWLGQVYLIAMEREVFYILWYTSSTAQGGGGSFRIGNL